MKKKELKAQLEISTLIAEQLKKQVADLQQSLERTNQTWDELNHENGKLADLVRSKYKVIANLQKGVKEQADIMAERFKTIRELSERIERTEAFIQKKDKIIAGLRNELADKTRELQEAWNGKENVQIRKDAAYWKEVFEISKESVKQYKAEQEKREKVIAEQRETITNLSNLSIERKKVIEELKDEATQRENFIEGLKTDLMHENR